MGVSFSWVKNPRTAHCLMCFDMVWNKSSILNGIQHIQLHFPSYTTWHTKAQGTVNKLGQVPLQGHTACMRYMYGVVTSGTSFVYWPLQCMYVN